MNITPEQARKWRDDARPGPWYVHTDSGRPDETFIYDETGHMCIAVEPAGSDYLEADLTLAAAAPELAQTVIEQGKRIEELEAQNKALRNTDTSEWGY